MIRNRNYNPIVQKSVFLKNREEEWQGIIAKNGVLLKIKTVTEITAY